MIAPVRCTSMLAPVTFMLPILARRWRWGEEKVEVKVEVERVEHPAPTVIPTAGGIPKVFKNEG